MTDRPIIFSAAMANALLAGRKVQTRRLAWRKTGKWVQTGTDHTPLGGGGSEPVMAPERKPTIWQRVQPGDWLYVREAFCQLYDLDDMDKPIGGIKTHYRADAPKMMEYVADAEETREIRWKPSIHMPRWASRLTLVVAETRMERLHDMSADDARAEGVSQLCKPHGKYTKAMLEVGPISLFQEIWENLHGVGAWDENPELVVLGFTVHKTNIDRMGSAIGRARSEMAGG